MLMLIIASSAVHFASGDDTFAIASPGHFARDIYDMGEVENEVIIISLI